MSNLAAQIEAFLGTLDTEHLGALADDTITEFLEQVFAQVSSHAAGIWLETQSHDELVLAFNVGGQGNDVAGQITQSLESGLISKAFLEKQTVCHQGMFWPRDHSDEVDRELHQITAHQVATPFRLFGRQCGVLTVVQTTGAPRAQKTHWGYRPKDIAYVENSAAVLSRLFEYNQLRAWLRA